VPKTTPCTEAGMCSQVCSAGLAFQVAVSLAKPTSRIFSRAVLVMKIFCGLRSRRKTPLIPRDAFARFLCGLLFPPSGLCSFAFRPYFCDWPWPPCYAASGTAHEKIKIKVRYGFTFLNMSTKYLCRFLPRPGDYSAGICAKFGATDK
jgi:hypothetical protein